MDLDTAIKGFFKGLEKGDINKMFKHCQLTWKSLHTKNDLKLFDYGVKDFSILDSRKVSSCCVDVDLLLKTDEKEYKVTARCLCERAAYRPHEKGRWGVNPISVLKYME